MPTRSEALGIQGAAALLGVHAQTVRKLALIMASVTIVVTAAAVGTLYAAAFEQARASLITSVRSEAALITSIAEHEQKHAVSGHYELGEWDADAETVPRTCSCSSAGGSETSTVSNRTP